MICNRNRLVADRNSGSRVPEPMAVRLQAAPRDSAPGRWLGRRVGRARYDVLKMSFYPSQPFAYGSDFDPCFSDLGRQALIHAEHLPIQPANRGEDCHEQRAVEPSVIHAEQLMAGR